MNLSLKKFKHYKSMSQETMCFEAELYDGPVHLAHVRNNGEGGCHSWSDYKAQRTVDTYARTLPDRVIGKGVTIPCDADGLVDDLAFRESLRPHLKRMLARYMWWVSKSTGEITRFAADDKYTPALADLRKVRSTDMGAVLNELPFEQALDLYVKSQTDQD